MRLAPTLTAASLLAAVACTPDDTVQPDRSPTTTASAATSTPTATLPSTTAPAQAHPVSLQALMRKKYDGRDLRVGRVLARNSAYSRYFVT